MLAREITDAIGRPSQYATIGGPPVWARPLQKPDNAPMPTEIAG
jgi:hypothetical protein